jgi:hypothetical protein
VSGRIGAQPRLPVPGQDTVGSPGTGRCPAEKKAAAPRQEAKPGQPGIRGQSPANPESSGAGSVLCYSADSTTSEEQGCPQPKPSVLAFCHRLAKVEE